MFLTFDGIDGTGKSTQCRLLVEWLLKQGHDVVHCVEPGTTPLGLEMRRILLGSEYDPCATAEVLLFMVARAELVERVIRPALAQGKWVVSDRYLLATIAYQGYGAQQDISAIRAVGQYATAGVLPDLAIVLDLPLERTRERLSATPDRMERRPPDYFERVRHGFLTEAQRMGERAVVVDASGSIAEVQSAIRALLLARGVA